MTYYVFPKVKVNKNSEIFNQFAPASLSELDLLQVESCLWHWKNLLQFEVSIKTWWLNDKAFYFINIHHDA